MKPENDGLSFSWSRREDESVAIIIGRGLMDSIRNKQATEEQIALHSKVLGWVISCQIAKPDLVITRDEIELAIEAIERNEALERLTQPESISPDHNSALRALPVLQALAQTE